MTIIQNNAVVDRAVEEVYTLLADLNNHEQLMPDNIYNWTSTADEARFTIQNMAKLALKVTQRTENKEIVCLPTEDVPFSIRLVWQFDAIAEKQTRATFMIEAELNMMMKMLASGPLQKLVDFQISKLKEILA